MTSAKILKDNSQPFGHENFLSWCNKYSLLSIESTDLEKTFNLSNGLKSLKVLPGVTKLHNLGYGY